MKRVPDRLGTRSERASAILGTSIDVTAPELGVEGLIRTVSPIPLL